MMRTQLFDERPVLEEFSPEFLASLEDIEYEDNSEYSEYDEDEEEYEFDDDEDNAVWNETKRRNERRIVELKSELDEEEGLEARMEHAFRFLSGKPPNEMEKMRSYQSSTCLTCGDMYQLLQEILMVWEWNRFLHHQKKGLGHYDALEATQKDIRGEYSPGIEYPSERRIAFNMIGYPQLMAPPRLRDVDNIEQGLYRVLIDIAGDSKSKSRLAALRFLELEIEEWEMLVHLGLAPYEIQLQETEAIDEETPSTIIHADRKDIAYRTVMALVDPPNLQKKICFYVAVDKMLGRFRLSDAFVDSGKTCIELGTFTATNRLVYGGDAKVFGAKQVADGFRQYHQVKGITPESRVATILRTYHSVGTYWAREYLTKLKELVADLQKKE